MRPSRNSLTFISSETSEAFTSNRKQSVKSIDSKKRMHGGADDKTSTSEISNKIQEADRPNTNEVHKSIEGFRYNTQDIQSDNNIVKNLPATAVSELTKNYPRTSTLSRKEESLKKLPLDNESTCFCGSYSTRSTGEKKIDEMMEYAIQNMNEAGKALSNLGDNFENDLKHMFMDIMGRVQHWVSVVENRIHAAKVDLESLRQEYITRDTDRSAKEMELVSLREKLVETEANLAALNKERLKIVPDLTQPVQAEMERVSTLVQTNNERDKAEKGEKDELESESLISLENTGCQCECDRKKATNREAELEAELAQLLEENEQMLKERTEYENEIHSALLKGVSSLNTEALKVLRYPPIPCCVPCGVSSMYSSSPKPVLPRRPKTVRCDAVVPQPVRRASNPVSKKKKISNEKSAEKNMVFLLHHGDAENQCQPCLQARYHPNENSSNKESICIGGTCKKLTTTGIKRKESYVARSPGSGSSPESCDLCVRSRNRRCLT